MESTTKSGKYPQNNIFKCGSSLFVIVLFLTYDWESIWWTQVVMLCRFFVSSDVNGGAIWLSLGDSTSTLPPPTTFLLPFLSLSTQLPLYIHSSPVPCGLSSTSSHTRPPLPPHIPLFGHPLLCEEQLRFTTSFSVRFEWFGLSFEQFWKNLTISVLPHLKFKDIIFFIHKQSVTKLLSWHQSQLHKA